MRDSQNDNVHQALSKYRKDCIQAKVRTHVFDFEIEVTLS